MLEKNVKSLSWQEGFVSSIDGVDTRHSHVRNASNSAQRCSVSVQYQKTSPISKIPGLNPDTEGGKPKLPISQKSGSKSNPSQIGSLNTRSNKVLSHGNSGYHLGDVMHKRVEHFSDSISDNKENKTRKLSENIKAWHEPEQEVPLIEQLIRKRSESRQTPVCRPDIVPVDQKGKIYFLINRNDGMITHIIKASPKQPTAR